MSLAPGLVLKHVEKNNIDQASLWPYEYGDLDAPDPVSAPTGPWSLYMDAGGSTYIWPTEKRNPHGGLPVWRGDKEELEKFFVFTSSARGYWDDHPYKYQADARGFNWPTGTLAGFHVARLVAEAFFSGDPGSNQEAWAIGKALEDRVHRAIDPEYWAARDAAELDATVDLDDIQA